MPERERDEFDRIVEGLTFESTDESEFLALEDADFQGSKYTSDVLGIDADDESASVDDDDPSGALLDDEPGDVLDADLPDFVEVTYREAPRVNEIGNPWRPRGWIALALLPFVLVALSAAGVYLAPSFIGLVVVAAVALLGYLIWTNPNRRSGRFPDDGSSI